MFKPSRDLRHRVLPCQPSNRCDLSHPDYLDNLSDLIETAIREELKRQSLTDRIYTQTNLYPPARFPLFDAKLHGVSEIVVCGPCDDDCIAVLRGAVSDLQDNLFNKQIMTDRQNLLLHFEVVTWFGLLICDETPLTKFLKKVELAIPRCLRSSLLLHAIRSCQSKVVEVLLENGAAADLGLDPKSSGRDHPLRLALDLTEECEQCKRDEYVAIVECLVKFGSSIRNSQEATLNILEDVPLARISRYAMIRPKLASMVLMVTPVEDLNCLCRDEFSLLSTPLGAVLRDVTYHAVNCCSTEAELKRTLFSAVLPLIRAGCRIFPDPYDTRLDICLLELLGKPELMSVASIFIDLINSSRRHITIDKSRIISNVEILDDLWPTDFLLNSKAVRRYYELVTTRYPLSLQALCRAVISNRLPLGARERPKAIERLWLPNCLSDYLNFREFDNLLS